jgi:hypothetical protein
MVSICAERGLRKSELSKTTAVCSWRARARAADRPAGPAPMMRASTRGMFAVVVVKFLDMDVKLLGTRLVEAVEDRHGGERKKKAPCAIYSILEGMLREFTHSLCIISGIV